MRRLAIVLLSLVTACGGCEELDPPIYANCGNGQLDLPETCDGNALGGMTCEALGFSGGTLACRDSCGGFVVSDCEGIRERVDPCSFCASWEGCVDGRCEATCDVDPLTEDTERTFSIEVVTVLGLVEGAAGGTVEFEGSVFWEPAVVPVAPDGTFEVRLSPGEYDVTWLPEEGAARAGESFGSVEVTTDTVEWKGTLTPVTELLLGVDPVGGTLVFEALDSRVGRFEVPVASEIEVAIVDGNYRVWWEHEEDEVRRFEFIESTSSDELARRKAVPIDLVDAEVAITLNGRALSEPGSRAELVLAEEPPRPSWVGSVVDREILELNAEGRASARVLNRPRDVALVRNGPPSGGWIWLGRGVDPGELALNVDLETVSGEVFRNGERLPNAAFENITRGRVEFASDIGSLSVDLTDRGRGEFSIDLPRGRWEVSVTGVIYSNVLPVLSHKHGTIDAPNDDLVIDVPAVRLAGELTVDGEAAPDDPELETRGSLQIRQQDSPFWFAVPIPPTGAARWDFIVAPGSYEAELSRWWFATGGEGPPPGTLPLGTWDAGRFEVDGPTRFDVDVPLVSVSVELTVDGEAPVGVVWFEDLLSQRTARRAATPDAIVRLFPGYYRVLWAPREDDGQLGDPVVLERFLTADDDAVLRVDLTRLQYSGRLESGEMLTDIGELEVDFRREPSANSTVTVLANPTGPAEFTAELYEGEYIVTTSAPDHPQMPQHGLLLEAVCN